MAWYALAIFLSSAGLMVLEIAAGRLLAPYIGVSLYSWTAIIGVVLAGIAFGTWLGGRYADRTASPVTLVGPVLTPMGPDWPMVTPAEPTAGDGAVL